MLLRDVNLFAKVDYYQSLVPGVVIMASISGDMLFLALFTVVAMTLSILTFKRTL